MAEHRPLKYQDGQHRPFAPGDTLPPDVLPPGIVAGLFRTCAGDPHQPGNRIPTCAELETAILQMQATFLQRIVAGTGIAITDGPGGTRIIANTCCDTDYQLIGITPVATPIVEGQSACWVIEVAPMVSGSPLALTLALSGSEQELRGYADPTGIVIPVGQTTVQVCVPTLDDEEVLGARQLCLSVDTPQLSPGGSACVAVLDNDEGPPSVHTVLRIDVSPGDTVPEGTRVCWEIVLDAPVTGAPVEIAIDLSGDEQGVNDYPVASPLIIPVGQSSGSFCVQTIDDMIDEPDRELALEIGTTPRIPTFSGARVPVTITDNDATVRGPAVIAGPSSGLGEIVGTPTLWSAQTGPSNTVVTTPATAACIQALNSRAPWAQWDPTVILPREQFPPECDCALIGQDVISVSGDQSGNHWWTDYACSAPTQLPNNLGTRCVVREGGNGTSVQYFVEFLADGRVTEGTSLAPATPGNRGRWLATDEQPQDYQMRVVSGDAPDGVSLGIWYPATTGLIFAWSYTLSGTAGGRFISAMLELRRVADGVIVDTASVEDVQLGVNVECV